MLPAGYIDYEYFNDRVSPPEVTEIELTLERIQREGGFARLHVTKVDDSWELRLLVGVDTVGTEDFEVMVKTSRDRVVWKDSTDRGVIRWTADDLKRVGSLPYDSMQVFASYEPKIA